MSISLYGSYSRRLWLQVTKNEEDSNLTLFPSVLVQLNVFYSETIENDRKIKTWNDERELFWEMERPSEE